MKKFDRAQNSNLEIRSERPAPLDFATWHARLRGHNDDKPAANLARGIGRIKPTHSAAITFDRRAA